MENNNRFPLAMRLLHWAMAALIISMLLAGLAMVRSLEPWQLTILTAHKAFGLLAFVLVILRIAIRMKSQTLPLPSSLSRVQKRGAIASHYVLYALMVAMPVSGYLMQYVAARPVEIFGLFTLPASLTADIESYGLFREIHGYLAIAFIAMILLHISAALHHHFVRKDSVLKSML
ncbi:cytochrome b [Alteromonas antoniana]|uniref:cytochrome b n=1 Tax=Alteromonas antoniana TaxID=2803813 RepID=UPI001C44BF27|nr:cytochrome b [Alteromonas antoniana]